MKKIDIDRLGLGVTSHQENQQIADAFAAMLVACNKVCCELDTLTGGEKSHPLANTVGHWKSILRAAIAKAEGGAAC